MTKAQKIAIENHCRLAGETIHPRFRTITGRVSKILTVNSGWE